MGPEQAQGILRTELAPCLPPLSYPHSMVPQGPYAAGVGSSMVLLPRGEKLCSSKISPQPGFLASLRQEEGMWSTLKKPKTWACGIKCHCPSITKQDEACHTLSIPQSLLPLSSTQLTPGPTASWLAPQQRTVLTAFGCAA